MEIARLEAIYTANTTAFDSGNKRVQAGFRLTSDLFSKLGNVIGANSQKAAGTYVDAQGRMREANGRFAKSAEDAASRASKAFGSFSGNLASDAVQRLASMALEGGKAILDYSSKLENSKVGFTTLMGSADAAQKHLESLQQFAKTTPFEFSELVGASQRLQGVGVQAEKVIPLMRDIGNAVAAVGGSSDQVNGVTVAIAQMVSKGKVSAEEMEQLAERQVNGWAMLSKELGVTQGEARKLAEDGMISADMFLQAFQKFSQNKFGDAMEKQSRTFSGAMSNIKDGIMIAANTAFAPLYEKISGLANEAAKEIEAQNGDFNAIGQLVGRYIVAGLTSTVSAGLGSLASYLASNIQDLFSGAPKQTPFFLKFFEVIAEGVGKGLGQNWDLFEKNVESTIPTLKQVENNVKTLANTTKNTPSLAKQLEAQKAAEQAKKLNESLGTLTKDLMLQISFFGDESETASIKQKLLTDGVTDFGSGLAKVALNLAGHIDKLKANQRAQEEFKGEVKDARQGLLNFADAAIKAYSSPQTELQKFDAWVSKLKTTIKSALPEIKGLREAMAFIDKAQALGAGLDRFKNIQRFIEGIVKETHFATNGLTKLEDTLLSVARAANLAPETSFSVLTQTDSKNKSSFDTTDLVFLEKSNKFIKEMIKSTDLFNERISRFGDDHGTFFSVFLRDTEKAKKEFTDFLKNLETFDENKKKVPLFDDKTLPAFVDHILNLGRTINDSNLKTGMSSLNNILGELGLTFSDMPTSKMAELNKQLADPYISAAIGERAKQLGMTTEALKELIQSRINGADTSVRPRIVPDKQDLELWRNFSLEIGDYFGNFFEDLRGGWKNALSGLVGDFANSLTQMASELFASSLFHAITGKTMDGQNSKGNWLTKLLGIGISAVGSAFGGKATSALGSTTKALGGATSFSGSLSAVGGGGQFFNFGGFRAEGGAVSANTAYWVGENKQPELFVPKNSGIIYNQEQLKGMQNKPSIHVTQNITIQNANPATARSSMEQAARQAFSVQMKAWERK